MHARGRAITVGFALAVGISIFGGLAPANAAESPKQNRVSAVTLTLDVMKTGAKVGPSICFGIVLSVLTIVVPGPGKVPQLDPVTQPLLERFGSSGAATAAQLSRESQDGITRIQQAIEPLAVLNPAINSGLETTAKSFEYAATSPAGPALQPADRTMVQMATLMRNFKESEK